MKKLLAAAGVSTALAAGPLLGAAPAQAYGSAYAHTIVSWGGTACIEHSGASNGNAYALGYGHTCMPYSHVAAWDETRYSGQWIGVDPIMGNADWIGCTITVNGYSYTDYASAGDGTDVNCLRVVN